MGLFQVTIAVGNTNGGDMHEVDVTVDTGSLHSVLPAAFLGQLSIAPITTRFVRFGDEGIASWPLGEARIAHAGEEWTCPVYFSPGDARLLGATTLEIFNLVVDPVNMVLVPAPPAKA